MLFVILMLGQNQFQLQLFFFILEDFFFHSTLKIIPFELVQ